jgi:IS6 family transposase
MNHRHQSSPPVDRSAFAGYRFPPEVIMLAVRWYLRYGLSYRDLEELLTERGIEVDHVTIHRWVQRFTPLLIDAARPHRHTVGGRCFVDETYVKVAGTWRYVYRAVDEHGQIIDVFVSPRRDLRAARTFFRRALDAHGEPDEVVTDLAQALETVIEELIPDAFHNTDLRRTRDRRSPLLRLTIEQCNRAAGDRARSGVACPTTALDFDKFDMVPDQRINY